MMVNNTNQNEDNPFDIWQDGTATQLGDLTFIWGVVSYDNLLSGEASFYTMNDIDIEFNSTTQKYSLSIETIYEFSSVEAEMNYLNSLLKAFTYYMDEHGYNTKIVPHLYQMFSTKFEASTIEELYAKFKAIVIGYQSLAYVA